MIAAGNLSVNNSGLRRENYDYLKNTIEQLPLPKLPEFSPEEILTIMQNDKKVQSGALHFILLEDIGRAVVQNNINEQSIINGLKTL